MLVNKLSYDFHSVHRGDIVVFKKPANDTTPGVNDLIKRVIGLPGETISAQDGQVYINGRLLPEPWLPEGGDDVPELDTRLPGIRTVVDPGGRLLHDGRQPGRLRRTPG